MPSPQLPQRAGEWELLCCGLHPEGSSDSSKGTSRKEEVRALYVLYDEMRNVRAGIRLVLNAIDGDARMDIRFPSLSIQLNNGNGNFRKFSDTHRLDAEQLAIALHTASLPPFIDGDEFDLAASLPIMRLRVLIGAEVMGIARIMKGLMPNGVIIGDF